MQIPHRRHLRREHPVRAESSLPRAHHPAHCRQRVRAHHGCAGCLQGQDGPGHRGGPGLLHPDRHLRVARAGPHWVCLPSRAYHAVPTVQCLLCSQFSSCLCLCPCLWGCACHAFGAVLIMPLGLCLPCPVRLCVQCCHCSSSLCLMFMAALAWSAGNAAGDRNKHHVINVHGHPPECSNPHHLMFLMI